jgi:hypothetical protein
MDASVMPPEPDPRPRPTIRDRRRMLVLSMAMACGSRPGSSTCTLISASTPARGWRTTPTVLSALLIESRMFQTRSIQSPASRFAGEHQVASSGPVNLDLSPPRAGRHLLRARCALTAGPGRGLAAPPVRRMRRTPHGRLATGLSWRHFSQRIDPSHIVYSAASAVRKRSLRCRSCPARPISSVAARWC